MLTESHRHLIERRQTLATASVALGLIILLFETGIPRGVASGVLYVFVVLFSLWSAHSRDVLYSAAFATILSVVGFFLKEPDGIPWMSLTNRGISVVAIWFAAYICWRRRDSEEKVIRAEERFEVLVESVPNAILMVDTGGGIVFANNRVESLFGYEKKGLLGKKVDSLVPENFRAKHADYREGYGANPHARPMGAGRDLYGLRRDGTEVPIEIGLTPIETSEGRFILASIVNIEERKKLEKEVLDATENERRRLGRELHDSLGQKLLGVGFLSRALQMDLTSNSLPQAAEAERIVQAINDALDHARRLAKGLYAVELLDSNDLSMALKRLTIDVQSMTGIRCEFKCRVPVAVDDKTTATNIFRIVQEALNNAIKHAKAKKLFVSIEQEMSILTIKVEDDGVGMPAMKPDSAGMGLKVMRYRANMVGASLSIVPAEAGGTSVQFSLVTPHALGKPS